MLQKIKFWVPLATAILCITGLVYFTLQQTIRQSANEPGIQMSEDIANRLAKNPDLTFLTSMDHVEMSQSLSPFVMVFTPGGEVVASTALLDGGVPILPPGVLASTKSLGQNRITWQPRSGVRSAIVVTYYPTGFVLVGRSLREVEKREDMLLVTVAGMSAVGLISSFIATLLFVDLEPKKRK